MPLELLSNAERAVASLVFYYLKTYDRRAFTYDSIKSYAARVGFYRKSRLTDRTLDRTLRRLAALGFFERRRRGRTVVYIPTLAFWELFQDLSKEVSLW